MSLRLGLVGVCLGCLVGGAALGDVGDEADGRTVLGTERGVGALGQSTASAALADGAALRLYQQVSDDGIDWGQFGGQLLLPIGPFSFDYSLDWFEHDEKRKQSTSFGFALILGQSSSFGISRRHYPGTNASWSASYYTEFDRWLTMALMADNFNAPTIYDEKLSRRYRAGWGLKPLHRTSEWVVGGEFELEETNDGSVEASRIGVSSRLPLGAGFSWDVVYRWDIGGKGELWTGVDLAFNTGDSQVQMGFASDILRSSTTNSRLGQYGWDFAVGGIDRPAVEIGQKVVSLGLGGTLRQEPSVFFAPPITASELLWDVYRLSQQVASWEIVVDLAPLAVGLATAEELADGLHRLRAHGKDVRVRLKQAAEREMLVASAAGAIQLDPYATIEMDGFESSRSFYRSTLSRIGIEFETLGVGEYKTAPDTYTRDSARMEDIQVRRELVNTFDDILVTRLSESRKLDRSVVGAALDQGYLLPMEALEQNFIDGLTFPDEASALPEKLKTFDNFRRGLRDPIHWGNTPSIAVVELNGNMTPDSQGQGLLGQSMSAKRTVAKLEALCKDDRVKAVVLRIDSPGGSVQAAEEMWRSARRLADRKPLIVSMGDVAASGGYYVATAAHRILALPSTVTGSIGIFLVRPNTEALFERLEVGRDVQKSRKHADRNSLSQAWTPEVRVKVQRALEHYYDKFIERVALARGIDKERADELGRGRVYTGRRALELGLVDGHGGVVEAILEAAEMAGLEPGDYRVAFSDPSGGWSPPSLGVMLQQGLAGSSDVMSPTAMLEALSADIEWTSLPLARLPFEFGEF